jgi:hypothetical protein
MSYKKTVDGTEIKLTSQAIGDTAYFDGTNWVRLAAGVAGKILTANGAAAPTWEDAPESSPSGSDILSTNTISLTASSDTIIYAASAGDVIYGIDIEVTVAVTNSGTSTLTVGSANGGNQFILSYALTSVTGTQYLHIGQRISQMGTLFTDGTGILNGYRYIWGAAGSIILSIAKTGTVDTGTIKVRVMGLTA